MSVDRDTRSRSEARKDLDNYVQSEAFVSLVDDAISKHFERFLSSQEFRRMLSATTTSVVSSLVQETLHASLDEVIQEKILPLKKQIETLSVEINEAKMQANDNEQYSRRCKVRIFGIPECESENCYEVVTELCIKKLACDFDIREIDRTNRVGRPRTGAPRAIIVKFCSYQSKIKILKHRRNLKGSAVFINEDMTAFNKEVFNYACAQLKDLSVSVWSSDGKVLVKQKDGRIVRVQTKDDVDAVAGH